MAKLNQPITLIFVCALNTMEQTTDTGQNVETNQTANPKTVKFNVGGKIFETSPLTLRTSSFFSAWLDHWQENPQMLFIDRPWVLFDHVLSLMRNPNYKYPPEICDALTDELDFYGLPPLVDCPQPCVYCNSKTTPCVTCDDWMCGGCQKVCRFCERDYCDDCFGNSECARCAKNCCPDCIRTCGDGEHWYWIWL